VKSFLIALSFLTIFPLPRFEFSREGQELSASASWFPFVGGVIGLFIAASAYVLSGIFTPGPIVVIAFIIRFFLTRGLHTDGLADAADGLIGTTNRDKAFKAMDDSAMGVMGGAVLILFYLLCYSLLTSGITNYLLLILFFMPVSGRWNIVLAGTWFKPARNKGLGDLFLSGLKKHHLIKASILPFVLFAVLFFIKPDVLWPVALGWLTAAVFSVLFATYAARRLGGISGDILGAGNEISELIFLITFVATQTLSG